MVLELVHFDLHFSHESLHFVTFGAHAKFFLDVVNIDYSFFAAILAENLTADPTVMSAEKDVEAFTTMFAVEGFVIGHPFCFLQVLDVGEVLNREKAFSVTFLFVVLPHLIII